jgi:hypothetical protein
MKITLTQPFVEKGADVFDKLISDTKSFYLTYQYLPLVGEIDKRIIERKKKEENLF